MADAEIFHPNAITLPAFPEITINASEILLSANRR